MMLLAHDEWYRAYTAPHCSNRLPANCAAAVENPGCETGAAVVSIHFETALRFAGSSKYGEFHRQVMSNRTLWDANSFLIFRIQDRGIGNQLEVPPSHPQLDPPYAQDRSLSSTSRPLPGISPICLTHSHPTPLPSRRCQLVLQFSDCHTNTYRWRDSRGRVSS